MRKPVLVGAALAGSVIAPLVVAASASAGSGPAPCPVPLRTPVIRSVTVSSVALTASNRPTAQVTVQLSDPDHVTSKSGTTVAWRVSARPTAAGAVGQASFPGTFTRVRNTSDVDTWTARSSALSLGDSFGRYRAAVRVDITNQAAGTAYHAATRRADFFVRGHVMVGHDAGPEPVPLGRALKVSGWLKQLGGDARHPGYAAAPRGVPVQFYFAAGQSGGTRRYVGKASTSSNGAYTKSFVAQQSGRWYVKFHGGTRFDAQLTGGDYVPVVR